MKTIDEFLEEQMKDPKFAEEWERQKPERELMAQMVEIRLVEEVEQDDISA